MVWKHVATTLGQQAKRTSYAQIPRRGPVVIHGVREGNFRVLPTDEEPRNKQIGNYSLVNKVPISFSTLSQKYVYLVLNQ